MVGSGSKWECLWDGVTSLFTHCLELSMEPSTSPGARQHSWELLAPRGYETIQPRAWCCLAQTQLCVTSVPAHVLVLEGTEPAFSLFWVTWLPSQPCLAMELMRGCGSGAGSTPARGEYSRAIDYTHVQRALLLAP